MRIITRRSAVAAGIGALSLVPTAAMAAVITRLGYREGGEAYEGLVTVEGSTYLYRAGVMYKGGAVEYKGSRWFSPEDGHMAVDEDVEWPDGTIHRYGPDGVMVGGAATAPVTEKELAAGWYTLTLASGKSLRLDVEGARAADGSRVYLQAADDGRGIEQKIRITWPDAQRVKIESAMGVLAPATTKPSRNRPRRAPRRSAGTRSAPKTAHAFSGTRSTAASSRSRSRRQAPRRGAWRTRAPAPSDGCLPPARGSRGGGPTPTARRTAPTRRAR